MDSFEFACSPIQDGGKEIKKFCENLKPIFDGKCSAMKFSNGKGMRCS